jgi:pyrimidine-specific ribonucleoside hydrolase
VVDRRAWSGDLAHDPLGAPAAMVDVALGVDGRRCSALWLDAVGGA